MDQPLDDDGYEPGLDIGLISGQTPIRSTEDLDPVREDDAKGAPLVVYATKRKSPGASSNGEHDASVKRQRLGEPQSQAKLVQSDDAWQRTGARLPVEIWQHVFTFVSPRQLGNLLAVNRLFHTILHPSPLQSLQDSLPSPTRAQIPSRAPIVPFLKAEAIWQSSRRTFCTGMPAPLMGKSELTMWRMVYSRTCQFCGVVSEVKGPENQDDAWHRGPGAKGVSPVFPFSIVSCGLCLDERSVKELDLILSSVPAALHPALPAVFLTQDLNVVSPATFQRDSDFSVRGRPSKIFWPEHIEQVKTEFESVRSLGSAAAEEWLKGLDARGKKALADASRWEKWDIAGGLNRLPGSLANESKVKVEVPSANPRRSSMENTAKDLPTFPQKARLDSGKYQAAGVSQQTKDLPEGPSLPGSGTSNSPSISDRDATDLGIKHSKLFSDGKKAERRAEIERRAFLLSPPISPDLLKHMPSFKAALQIPSSLDESAWNFLRPRLLAQREYAEKRAVEEQQQQEKTRALEKENVSQDKMKPSSDDVPDFVWDEAQGPLRARLVQYADDIIHRDWEDGDKVSKKSAARFAVQVLLHVRKSFYADVEREAATARASGKQPVVDPPEGPWTRKLTLENMKWIFDLKVRPLTEKFKKEPFFCNGCTQSKTFGLEGVVQHFAAKHNNGLSRGSVVVYWRAEWPAETPFSPDHTRPGLAAPPKESNPKKGQQNQQAQSQAKQAPVQTAAPTSLKAAPPTQPKAHYNGSYTDDDFVVRSGTTGPTSGLPHHTAPDLLSQTMAHPGQRGVSEKELRKTQLKFMLQIAQPIWDVVAESSGAASIKAAILVHHLARQYEDRHGEMPSIDVFAECINRLEKPVAASTLQKIQCKACGGTSGSTPGLKFSSLVSHFKSSHMQGGKRPQPDWRTEMVFLPHINELKKLPQMLAWLPEAYALAEDAMPWAFDPRTNQGFVLPRKKRSRSREYPYDEPSRNARRRRSRSPYYARDASSRRERTPPSRSPPRGPSKPTAKYQDSAEERAKAAAKAAVAKLASKRSAASTPSRQAAVPYESQLDFHVQRSGAKPLPNKQPPAHVQAPLGKDSPRPAPSQAALAFRSNGEKDGADDEDMEDARDSYSPPPPEAYDTTGARAAVELASQSRAAAPQPKTLAGDAPAQYEPPKQQLVQSTLPVAQPGKQNGKTSGAKRPSSYYHDTDQPVLRPAREVYTKKPKKHSNGNAPTAARGDIPMAQTALPSYEQRRPMDPGMFGYPQYPPFFPGMPVPGAGYYPPFDWTAAQGRMPMPPAIPTYEEYDPYDPGLFRESAQPAASYRRQSGSSRAADGSDTTSNRERSPLRYRFDRQPAPAAGYYAPHEPVEPRHDVEYEVVRVRDPAGDYLLRRPIRQQAYGYDAPPLNAVDYPHRPQQQHYASAYGAGPSPYPLRASRRASTIAPPPHGYGAPAAYEEYDPRDAGRMLPPPPPPPQQMRYGTEPRF